MLRKEHNNDEVLVDNSSSTNKMNGRNANKINLATSESMIAPVPGTMNNNNNNSVPKRKQHKKLVRLLTVAAYVFFVSLGAIVLSLYYVFLWDPQMEKVSKRFTAIESSTPDTETVVYSHQSPTAGVVTLSTTDPFSEDQQERVVLTTAVSSSTSPSQQVTGTSTSSSLVPPTSNVSELYQQN